MLWKDSGLFVLILRNFSLNNSYLTNFNDVSVVFYSKFEIRGCSWRAKSLDSTSIYHEVNTAFGSELPISRPTFDK